MFDSGTLIYAQLVGFKVPVLLATYLQPFELFLERRSGIRVKHSIQSGFL